jgi:hypothetical protein
MPIGIGKPLLTTRRCVMKVGRTLPSPPGWDGTNPWVGSA